MRKTIISGVIATVLGGVVLIGIERFVSNDDTTPLVEGTRDINIENAQYSVIEVELSGSNNDLIISKSESSLPAQSVSIVGSNIDREISIPTGQQTSLTVAGSNNKIRIHSSIFDQISVSELGANNKIQRLIIKKGLNLDLNY